MKNFRRVTLDHPAEVQVRLEERSIPVTESGCWLWDGFLDKGGYGHISIKGWPVRAHRASWLAYRGEIPDGLCVLHECDVPSCINPSHLFLGTDEDNMRDRARKNRVAFGTRSGQSKLKPDQVLAIRASDLSDRELARLYGVSAPSISSIRRRQTWARL